MQDCPSDKQQGNAYVTGTTDSPDFPTTAGAFDTVLSGLEDTFVAKIVEDKEHDDEKQD